MNRRMHLDISELWTLSGVCLLCVTLTVPVCDTGSSSVCITHFGCISTGDGSHTGGERCPLQPGI